jgi:hypothetical protein
LLKLPWGEVYDMLIVKTEKIWGHRTRFEDMQYATFSPHMAPAILTLLRVTGTIAIAQPLLNSLTRILLKMSIYSDYIYRKKWYLSQSSAIFEGIIFPGARLISAKCFSLGPFSFLSFFITLYCSSTTYISINLLLGMRSKSVQCKTDESP